MRTIWITGAGSGIGEALALAYAEKGTRLILSGRNVQALKSVAQRVEAEGAEAMVVPLDLSQSDSFKGVVDSLRDRLDRIDMLVSNAGMSQRSRILETSQETERRIFEVNYFGTVELSRLVLQWMVEKGGGQMVVMSSISGKFGFPLRSTYAATKHAVLGFFGTMDLEYRDKGIAVTMICPGRINTNISLNALRGDGTKHESLDQGLSAGMDAARAARKMRRAIDKRKYMVYVGGKELLMVFLFKYVPALFRKVARMVSPT